MKVSIITVCLNSEKYIGDAIRSVLSQTHADLEYIIADGGSGDGTPGIIKSFGNRISLLAEGPDQGPYDAMNKGITLASGEVIGFLNSDDLYSGNKVISKVAEMFGQTGTDSVYGDIQYIDREESSRILTSRRSGTFSRRKMWLGWHPPHPAFFIRRRLFSQFGNFDSSFTISADYDLMIRMLAIHRIQTVYLPEVLVLMREGGRSNRTMKDVRQKWREDRRVLEKNNFGSGLTWFIKTMRPVAHFYRSPSYLFR